VGTYVYHVVNLRSPEDLNETVRGWLTESYDIER
jgi:hypothetical protein